MTNIPTWKTTTLPYCDTAKIIGCQVNKFIIPEKEADVIESDISGWKKVDGEPTMKSWIEYATKVALCGTWEATVGTYRECVFLSCTI